MEKEQQMVPKTCHKTGRDFMKVICEHARYCNNARDCQHGSTHEKWEGCVVGECYHHSKTGENHCLPVLEGF